MTLRFAVQTPNETIVSAMASSVRVPTMSGLVGLRPREEPYAVVVEAGLIIVHTDAGKRLVASAGGLLSVGRDSATLFTPFAVCGEREADVEVALQRALASQDEVIAHRKLGELEHRIIRRVGASGLMAQRGPTL